MLCWIAVLAATACTTTARDATLSTGAARTTTTTVPAPPETTTTTPAPVPTTPPATDRPPETTTSAPTTSTTTTTTRPPVLSGPVTYSIQGGIAGVNDRLTIAADGTATFQSATKSTRYNVAQAQLLRLSAALDQANFPQLQAVYGVAVPDGFEYRVSYETKTVLIFGSSEPSRLKPALSILSQEMERARTS